MNFYYHFLTGIILPICNGTSILLYSYLFLSILFFSQLLSSLLFFSIISPFRSQSTIGFLPIFFFLIFSSIKTSFIVYLFKSKISPQKCHKIRQKVDTAIVLIFWIFIQKWRQGNQDLGLYKVAKKKTPSALERLCVPEDKCSALPPQFLP